MSGPPERAGRPRVGFLGPAGTFTEEALLAGAGARAVDPVAFPSIYETIVGLREGEVELAIAPIENSLEGGVNVTLDLLADEAGELRIVGEQLLRVRHSLIACAAVGLQEIRTVLTHPQVPGQCSRFLRGELAHATVLPASSTAEAVRLVVAGGDRSTAALGTTLAAQIYGGEVIREGVEDREDNVTRFVWLARAGDEEAALPGGEGEGEWRCSIVFWGPGAARAGWLVRCLDEFAGREINLTKIESRPRRRELGTYVFFADLAAEEHEPRVAQALAGLAGLCEEVRVLGSYRAASAPAAAAG